MSAGLVSTDEARAILSGEGQGCDLATAVRDGRDTLDNTAPYDATGARGRAIAFASELLGDVERLTRTVILLRSREAAKAALEAELALHQQDLADAAGELMVPVPPPDSMAAKLMRANRILRSMHDEACAEVRRLRALLPEGVS